MERKAAHRPSREKWKDILTQHARINQKWFYLPPDERLGFADKMAVDFMGTLRVPCVEFGTFRDLAGVGSTR